MYLLFLQLIKHEKAMYDYSKGNHDNLYFIK